LDLKLKQISSGSFSPPEKVKHEPKPKFESERHMNGLVKKAKTNKTQT
jgi:hypothetical protein